METMQNYTVMFNLLNQLKDRESWCGETHLQKASYFLKELTGVPIVYEFILYKHGPFSFDIHDELPSMRADGLIEYIQKQYPYGPSLSVTDAGNDIVKRHPVTTRKYESKIRFIARQLGSKGVGELEKLGTALYFLKKSDGKKIPEIAKEMIEIKPHIIEPEALKALSEVQELIKKAKSVE